MGNFLLGFFIGGFFGIIIMGILNASKLSDDDDDETMTKRSNLLVILGKTASGKDTIVNKLVSEYGYKKLVTYTSRPMRQNEVQDATYHFISDKDFKQKIKDGFFAEWKSYKTKDGVWYYGTALEDLENADDNMVVILTPAGYRDVIKRLLIRPKSIYVHANKSTIRERLNIRGDNPKEAKRRLKHDNKDFKGIQDQVDKVVFNNAGDYINDIVDEILCWLQCEYRGENYE